MTDPAYTVRFVRVDGPGVTIATRGCTLDDAVALVRTLQALPHIEQAWAGPEA